MYGKKRKKIELICVNLAQNGKFQCYRGFLLKFQSDLEEIICQRRLKKF